MINQYGLPLSAPFVIFLDIDGVLVNERDYRDEQRIKKTKELFPGPRQTLNEYDQANVVISHLFNATALKNLDTIISAIEKTSPLSVVISSTWRINKSVDQLKTFFNIHNFSKYLIDMTPHSCTAEQCEFLPYHSRPTEIHSWLKNHPEVTDYLIFDDKDYKLSLFYMNKFVHIDSRKLITSELVCSLFNSYSKTVYTLTGNFNKSLKIIQMIPDDSKKVIAELEIVHLLNTRIRKELSLKERTNLLKTSQDLIDKGHVYHAIKTASLINNKKNQFSVLNNILRVMEKESLTLARFFQYLENYTEFKNQELLLIGSSIVRLNCLIQLINKGSSIDNEYASIDLENIMQCFYDCINRVIKILNSSNINLSELKESFSIKEKDTSSILNNVFILAKFYGRIIEIQETKNESIKMAMFYFFFKDFNNYKQIKFIVDLANCLSNDQSNFIILRKIFDFCIKNNYISESLDMIPLLSTDSFQKSIALSKISCRYAKNHAIDKAKYFASLIPDLNYKFFTIGKIGCKIANNYKINEAIDIIINEAIDIIDAMPQCSYKYVAIIRIVCKFFAFYEDDEYYEDSDNWLKETIDSISDPSYRAIACKKISCAIAKSGYSDKALYVAKLILDQEYQSFVIKKISYITTGLHDTDTALKLARFITNSIDQAAALKRICIELAWNKKKEEAEDIANSICDSVQKSLVLDAIADTSAVVRHYR